ncbi:MAG: nitrogenase iron-molybdenum cofactor biosynthesis protein NifE [Calditerrivibrio sp.]|nr:nitrogenase iron-molybdenum cofactor biosynthesis protein NifE [Calditerrivibrio sp.]
MGAIQVESNKNCHLNKEKDSKPKCTKPTPGAAVGGCAFDGAMITLVQISDAAHIIHSTSTCITCSWNNRGTRSSVRALYRYGITTNISEIEIILGTEEKLKNTIIKSYEKLSPKAIFVYNTCVTDMYGEDLQRICQEMSNFLNIPVIPVESPGYIGNKNYGNKAAGETLFKYVIGTKEPIKTTPFDISIIADYNIAGELWRVLPYFEELGINVLSKITGDATYDEVAYAHRAKCSVVICSRALMDLAEKLYKKYNIPYMEGSFYGIRETSNTLRSIGKMLNDNNLIERIERFIEIKEKEIRSKLSKYISLFQDKKVFIYSGGVKSWSMVLQLEELGFEVIGSGIRKSSKQDIEKLKKHFEGKQKILLEKGEGGKIIELLKKNDADLFIAGSRNMFVSMKARYPYVDVNQERLRAYAGYEGMIDLAEDIYNTMFSPIWNTIKHKPLFMEDI